MAEHEEEDGEGGGAASARGVWSGAVTFGLVSIPVALMPAARSGGPHFRMLGPNGTPIARRWVCSKDDEALDDADIVRGYEVRKGRFVVVTDEELEALEPKRSKEIEIERFVPLGDIEPVYFERPYYLAPLASAKAYSVLARVMEKTERAAIASFVMHDREHAIVLLAESGLLRASTMRFAEDVREPGEIGIGGTAKKAEAKRVKALQRAIARLRGTKLDEKLLEDEYAARVEAEAKKKRKRGSDVVEVAGAPEEEEAELDLTAALRAALARSGKRRPTASRRRGKHATRGRGRKGGRRKSAA